MSILGGALDALVRGARGATEGRAAVGRRVVDTYNEMAREKLSVAPTLRAADIVPEGAKLDPEKVAAAVRQIEENGLTDPVRVTGSLDRTSGNVRPDVWDGLERAEAARLVDPDAEVPVDLVVRNSPDGSGRYLEAGDTIHDLTARGWAAVDRAADAAGDQLVAGGNLKASLREVRSRLGPGDMDAAELLDKFIKYTADDVVARFEDMPNAAGIFRGHRVSPDVVGINPRAKNELGANIRGYALVHEAAHHITTRWVRDNPGSQLARELDAAMQEARQRAVSMYGRRAGDAIEYLDLPDEMADAVKLNSGESEMALTLYGLKNVDEFLAEILSNAKFRDFLASSEHAATGRWNGRIPKVLDSIIKKIAEVLGVSSPKEMRLLSHVMTLSREALDAGAAWNRRPGVKQARTAPRQLIDKSNRSVLQTLEGRDNVAINVTQEQLDRMLPETITLDTLGRALAGPGWEKSRFVGISYDAAGRLRVSIQGTPSGASTVTRTFDFAKGEVHHDLFKVSGVKQRQGVARQLQRSAVEMYRKAGIHTVTMEAGLDTGGYAWLRYGYLPEHPKTLVNDIMRELKYRIEGLPEGQVTEEFAALQARASAWKDNPFVNQMLIEWSRRNMPTTAEAVQDAVEQGVGAPVLKELYLGTLWKGKLDLRNKDQMKMFEEYTSGY